MKNKIITEALKKRLGNDYLKFPVLPIEDANQRLEAIADELVKHDLYPNQVSIARLLNLSRQRVQSFLTTQPHIINNAQARYVANVAQFMKKKGNKQTTLEELHDIVKERFTDISDHQLTMIRRQHDIPFQDGREFQERSNMFSRINTAQYTATELATILDKKIETVRSCLAIYKLPFKRIKTKNNKEKL